MVKQTLHTIDKKRTLHTIFCELKKMFVKLEV
jgi:hypothetical protein